MSDEMRRRALDFFEQIGNGDSGVKPGEEMNVVRHTADGKGLTLQFTALVEDGGIGGLFDFGVRSGNDPRLPRDSGGRAG
jgi:hypothetical protein